ncbi:hypothetical protein [Palaeococcus sp. (in: euryarchaeotes)]|uniref:hypothetical protein n=1 Tax=Palaeococcus sp. (in: euryarchaeotes) TaxID=2820298 RepID=UPI000F0DE193|nr:hypothetical protein [Palaeococcus sp. (in: euryarchaeotes)]MCD6559019.1 hypothetical protein [Palaeococcus sp. (in: euryarchaeotes)]RLF75025.1 MAG: hypothetical protein DRN39_07815 [Thermococci archaeon]
MSAIIAILFLILIVLNIVLLLLYISARRTPYYVVYDEETKNALKSRVLNLKEDLEAELEEFDVAEWEKSLEESIEEEIREL